MRNTAYRQGMFFRKYLTAYMIPAIIPMLILVSLSIIITLRYVKQEINLNSIQLLEQTSQNVDLILSDLETLSLNFDTNPHIIVTLKNILNKDSLTFDETRELNTLKSFLESAVHVKPYIYSTYAFYNNDQGKFISTSTGLTALDKSLDKDWYPNFDRMRNVSSLWSEIRLVREFSYEKPRPILTVYKNLFSPGMNEADGVIVLNLKVDFLEQMLGSHLNYPDQSLLVLNENNQVIISSGIYPFIQKEELHAIIASKDHFFTLKTKG